MYMKPFNKLNRLKKILFQLQFGVVYDATCENVKCSIGWWSTKVIWNMLQKAILKHKTGQIIRIQNRSRTSWLYKNVFLPKAKIDQVDATVLIKTNNFVKNKQLLTPFFNEPRTILMKIQIKLKNF